MRTETRPELEFLPATPDRWPDLESLFGRAGAYGGCWCMWWRLRSFEYARQKAPQNRAAMQALVENGVVPGLLAYSEGRPVGWVSVGPRGDFPRLVYSRVLKSADERTVWSVVCFFVARTHRRHGMMAELLQAAIDYARSRGAAAIEGYPLTRPKGRKLFGADGYTGTMGTFRRAGFRRTRENPRIARLELV